MTILTRAMREKAPDAAEMRNRCGRETKTDRDAERGKERNRDTGRGRGRDRKREEERTETGRDTKRCLSIRRVIFGVS